MIISWKNCFKLGITILAVVFIINCFDNVAKFVSLLLGALLPVVIGGVIAYLLNILMCFYEKHYFKKLSHKNIIIKTKRPVCMLAAILSFCVIIAAVIGLVIPELISCVKFIVSEIPPAINTILNHDWVEKNIPEDILSTLGNIDWNSYLNKAVSVISNGVTGVVDIVVSTVTSIVSGVVTSFLSIVFAIYLLLFKERLLKGINRIINVVFKEKVVVLIKHCADVCNRCFHGYIVGQCTEAVILGALCVIGMLILRIPYAVMIGTLVGFTALIPIAGAYIGAIIGAFMILTVSPVKALIFVIFLIALQQFEGNLIYPKVVGDSIGLPAVFVLLAVTVGGGIAGVAGMLVGVPLVATFYRLLREYIVFREKNNVVLNSEEEKCQS